MRITNYLHERSFGPVTVGIMLVAIAIPIAIAHLNPGPEVDLYLAWVLTIITGIGVVATAWTWWDSFFEARAIKTGDRSLRMIANANVRREALRAAVLLGLFWIGFSILINRVDSTINRSVFIELALALVSNSLLDRLERRGTARILRAEIKAGHAHGGGQAQEAPASECCQSV